MGQGLEIGGYELTFLSDLVASYLIEKTKTLLNRTSYYGIYQDDGLVVFKGKKNVQEIKDWLVEFQKTVEKAAGNQHPQFTTEIWTNDENLPPSAKKDEVQIRTNDKFRFLEIKMSWSPDGDLKFGVFKKKGQKLKHVGMGNTHTPGTLCPISSGVLNRLAKLTFKKTLFSF